MAKQGQGVAVAARSRADGDPPGAKPLDHKNMKINGFLKAVGLWWVQGKALVLAFSIGQSLDGVGIISTPIKNDRWYGLDFTRRHPSARQAIPPPADNGRVIACRSWYNNDPEFLAPKPKHAAERRAGSGAGSHPSDGASGRTCEAAKAGSISRACHARLTW